MVRNKRNHESPCSTYFNNNIPTVVLLDLHCTFAQHQCEIITYYGLWISMVSYKYSTKLLKGNIHYLYELLVPRSLILFFVFESPQIVTLLLLCTTIYIYKRHNNKYKKEITSYPIIYIKR